MPILRRHQRARKRILKLLDEIYPFGQTQLQIARAARLGMSQTGIVLVELESKHLIQRYLGMRPDHPLYRINR